MCGEMVRATLDGRKTQTRRVVNPQPGNVGGCYARPDGLYIWTHLEVGIGVGVGLPFKCPFGEPGDVLFVKETFYNDLPEEKNTEHIYYRADGECCEQIPECCCAEIGKPKWKPSIFMPRWASRITLEIVSVRVERLKEISEEDAKAEGIEGRWHPKDANCWTWKDYAVSSWAPEPRFHYGSMVTPVSTFEGLWDSINAKTHPWASNPWVWVLEFNKLNRI